MRDVEWAWIVYTGLHKSLHAKLAPYQYMHKILPFYFDVAMISKFNILKYRITWFYANLTLIFRVAANAHCEYLSSMYTNILMYVCILIYIIQHQLFSVLYTRKNVWKAVNASTTGWIMKFVHLCFCSASLFQNGQYWEAFLMYERVAYIICSDAPLYWDSIRISNPMGFICTIISEDCCCKNIVVHPARIYSEISSKH